MTQQDNIAISYLSNVWDQQAQQRSQMLKEGCLDIEKSPKLLKLLEIVLAIGNYLNAQSIRGGAYGFKLEVLTKLSQVKKVALSPCQTVP